MGATGRSPAGGVRCAAVIAAVVVLAAASLALASAEQSGAEATTELSARLRAEAKARAHKAYTLAAVDLEEHAVQHAMMVSDRSASCHRYKYMVCRGGHMVKADWFLNVENVMCSPYMVVSELLKLLASRMSEDEDREWIPTQLVPTDDHYVMHVPDYEKLADKIPPSGPDGFSTARRGVRAEPFLGGLRVCSIRTEREETMPESKIGLAIGSPVRCTTVEDKRTLSLFAVSRIAELAAMDGNLVPDPVHDRDICVANRATHYWRDECCPYRVTRDRLCGALAVTGPNKEEEKRKLQDQCGLSWPVEPDYTGQCPSLWHEVPGHATACTRSADKFEHSTVPADCCQDGSKFGLPGGADACVIDVGGTAATKKVVEGMCRVQWPSQIDYSLPCPAMWDFIKRADAVVKGLWPSKGSHTDEALPAEMELSESRTRSKSETEAGLRSAELLKSGVRLLSGSIEELYYFAFSEA